MKLCDENSDAAICLKGTSLCFIVQTTVEYLNINISIAPTHFKIYFGLCMVKDTNANNRTKNFVRHYNYCLLLTVGLMSFPISKKIILTIS